MRFGWLGLVLIAAFALAHVPELQRGIVEVELLEPGHSPDIDMLGLSAR